MSDFSSFSKEELSNKLTLAYKKLVMSNDRLLDTFTNNLFEDDTWDAADENENLFFSRYKETKTALEEFETIADEYRAKYVKNQEKFKDWLKYYYTIKEDLHTYAIIIRRHKYFFSFYNFRKTIIMNLLHVLGEDKENTRSVFMFFNEKLNSVPLKELQNTYYREFEKEYLDKKYPAEMDHYEKTVGFDTMRDQFNLYKKYRAGVLDIFNGLCSDDPYKGYEAFGKNYLEKYCTGRTNYNTLKQLWTDYVGNQSVLVPGNARNKKSGKVELTYGEYMDRKALKAYENAEYPSYNSVNENLKENFLHGVFKEGNPNDIVKVSPMTPKGNQCKVIYDGEKVYSACVFHPGDIVEICPCKVIDNSALYSRDMRDIVFEIVPQKKYACPFGYAQYYGVSDDEHFANCDYMYDPNTNSIVIKACRRIPKNAALILKNFS